MNEAVLIEEMKKAFNLDAIISLDFETFYGKGYSLKNKPYYEYIMDERFHAQMLGVGEDAEPIVILDDYEMDGFSETIRARRMAGERIGVVAQNTHFDAAILSWRFGLTFDFYFDAMLLSRLRFINHSASLKNHAQRLWPDDPELKKGDALKDAMNIDDLHSVPHLYENMSAYCRQDVNLTRKIVLWHWQSDKVPQSEWMLMHITLRACVEPQFWINQVLLNEVVTDEAALKERLVSEANEYLQSVGVNLADAATYSSNQKYKALIELFGMKVPYKMDPETYEMKPALGKTDAEYVKFQGNHPEMKPIFRARNAIKSTIAVSRANRLIDVANTLPLQGFIPFPLNYHEAHTGRWSGGQKMNVQNLQRKSKHRLCLTAPEGYVVLVRDLSGIELRMNLWFCEQDDLLQIAHAGDIYSLQAESVLGHPVNKKDNPDDRQLGKVITLGMGYGMGWKTFQDYMAGGPMGMEPVFFPASFCREVKSGYDLMNPMIKQMWHFLNSVVIPAMVDPACDMEIGRHGCVKVRYQKIILPSGRELQYDGLHASGGEDANGYSVNYRYDDGTRDRFKNVVWKKLYGGLLLENIIQALARDVVAYHIVLAECEYIQTKYGWVVGSVHDEILSIIREQQAQEAYDRLGAIMSTPPTWCYDLPLASEGGWDKVYSK